MKSTIVLLLALFFTLHINGQKTELRSKQKSVLSVLEQQQQFARKMALQDEKKSFRASFTENKDGTGDGVKKRSTFSLGGKKGGGFGQFGKLCRCKVGGQLMFLVRFVFSGEGVLTAVPEANVDNTPGTPNTGTDEALCFTGRLYLPSGEQIGIGSDCPYPEDIIIENTTHTSPSGTKEGISGQNRNGLAIFNFGGGNVAWARSFNLMVLMNRGRDESGTSEEMTHVTGFYPDPTNGQDNDYYLENSSGIFDEATGEIRLSGHINLDLFDFGSAEGVIKWDCYFHFFLRHPVGWPRWWVNGVLHQPCDPDPSFFDFRFWNLLNN